ncbi:hypothetical protein [Timonella sp. A28]|uniref:hypothetical protein n=1 Tax=Timonella sp. A28 TaxID=3442640 RepID=UPI003EBD6FC7
MSQATPPPFNQEQAKLMRARQRVEIATLDYKRALKNAKGKMTQAEISKAVHISQPAVAKALRDTTNVPDALDGFSAASPFELCQRYAAGFIDREDMLDQLARWPYRPTPHPDEFGDYTESFNGTFSEVSVAVSMGLLSSTDYKDLYERLVSQHK